MPDDYLWSKSGEPDPEVARLERLLGRYRHAGGGAPAPPARTRHWRSLAWAACVLLTMSSAWLVPRGGRARWTLAAGEASARGVQEGEWIETAGGPATLRLNDSDEIRIEPNTRLRVDSTRAHARRLRMARGEITAMIYAPARTLFIDTPSAAAVDLGCKFVLRVDEGGNGRLRVVLGWVGFETEDREVFIPEQAWCETRAGHGPGTPWYEDASDAFRAALARLDFENGGEEPLATVLAEARTRDAVSLWHLLSTQRGEARERVHDRLAQLVPPPPGVTRAGILSGDARQRDLWWNALGLENIEWWRKWKGMWPGGK